MKSKRLHMYLFNLAFLVFLTTSCKAPQQRGNGAAPVMIRVGILEERPQVDFLFEGQAHFRNPNETFNLKGAHGGQWQVKVLDSNPAKFVYRLSVGTTRDRFQAEKILRSINRKGLGGRVEKINRGRELSIPNIGKSIYQILLDKKFNTKQEANLYRISIKSKTNAAVIKIPVGESQGTLQFTNLDNNYSFDSAGPIRLSAAEIEVADVDVGSGFHWESSEHQIYGGTIEFLLDAAGKITVVNEITLEEYLKGVVPSEMPAGFPYEALKAQAIASRCEAISKTGRRHPYSPFDLCDDVHCQVFSGNSKRAERASMAVESTRGIFMLYRDKLAEAFYSGVCGGHTENNENVWLVDAEPYLRGVLDRNRKRLGSSLADESNVKKWIDHGPDVYCNITRGKTPDSFNYARKYFRWQVEYERFELETIIREKTGVDFGRLIDLKPLRRGVSGRLIELEVVGTGKSFVISRELPIRQALSRNTLFSACFYIDKKSRSGNAQKYILKGAGWGHGVGMCQVGAAVMANTGKKFDQILTHYYSRVYLKKLYK